MLFLLYAVLRLLQAGHGGAVEYLVAGRRLTLPAFVATLVSTWYGGILGVGEYAWRHGLSNWLVFGVPYYLYAARVRPVLAAPRAPQAPADDPRPARPTLRPRRGAGGGGSSS